MAGYFLRCLYIVAAFTAFIAIIAAYQACRASNLEIDTANCTALSGHMTDSGKCAVMTYGSVIFLQFSK